MDAANYGYGDQATWGDVCSPYDPRANDSAWFDAAVNERTAEIVTQRMSNPDECGEYMQVISDEAWRAFESCVAQNDAIEAMRVMRNAICAAMNADARIQAMRELEDEE